MTPIDQHREEIEKNLDAWNNKPLLQNIYARFYQRIVALIDRDAEGAILEIGSGIGNLKAHLPEAISSDLFLNPWLDIVCDGYDLPFKDHSISHLVLFDVFHHLEAPNALLKEADRVLTKHGRVILFEPYISLTSYWVYALLHHEPVAWRKPIRTEDYLDRPRNYYAAQGNATRLFFNDTSENWSHGWKPFHAEAFSAFSYLLSGGYSKPAVYPERTLDNIEHIDKRLSRWPRLFGGRCLVGLFRHAARTGDQVRGPLVHAPPAADRTKRAPMTRRRDQPIEPTPRTPEPREASAERATSQKVTKLLFHETGEALPVAKVSRLRQKRLKVFEHDVVQDARRGLPQECWSDRDRPTATR